ncbi:efflux RND transporter periplasmic adaptor subunit [Desulfurobacterium thermolithotrophum]|uniref:efflux RND transporter periplasmic adaptor subunit n=1 Tax=Desulfurobacterium thermolithotrophum TaxID=64160 RepID=UPI0013D7AE2E|nr:efflux RND transporter periplasmic adaptor subunit [Desulfurobacterium thermolithotrophum]
MIKKLFLTIALLVFISSCDREENVQHVEIKTVHGVKVSNVETIKIEKKDSFSGTVIPDKQIRVSPKVIGYLKEIKVKVGDRVRKGEILAVIDSSEIKPDVKKAKAALKEVEAALREIDKAMEEVKALKSAAKANYDFTQRTYVRFKRLYESEAVSKQKFDEIKTKLEEAKSKLKAIEAKEAQLLEKKKGLLAKKEQVKAELSKASAFLSYTYLKSPIDGIVLKKLVDNGNLIFPQTSVFQLGSYPLRVHAFIDSSYAGKVKVGETLPVKLKNKVIMGKVTEVDESADPVSHKFGIKVDIGSPKGVIPGDYAVVEIPTVKVSEIVIPISAVYRIGAIEYVFVIKDGIANLRVIKTGKRIGNKVIVLSGLHEGEKIAVSGVENLCDGARVEG